MTRTSLLKVFLSLLVNKDVNYFRKKFHDRCWQGSKYTPDSTTFFFNFEQMFTFRNI